MPLPAMLRGLQAHVISLVVLLKNWVPAHAGFGVGLANQSVPLYLSEIAPPKMRGGLNNLFQVRGLCIVSFEHSVACGRSLVHQNRTIDIGLNFPAEK